MKFKNLTNAITSKVGRQVLVARKHSPTLFFVGGVVGVVTTVVLASRATLKLEEVLEDTKSDLAKRELVKDHEEYSHEDYMKDGVKIYTRAVVRVAKLYAPAALVGLASIGALTGSHVVLTRRNTAIMAAYAALDQGFRQYRQRVVQELGEEKDREFRYDMQERTIVKETPEGPVTKTIKESTKGSVYARLFDETNINWNPSWVYNQIYLQSQQNWANTLLRSRGHVFLNEVYDMLGLSRVPEGQVVGWLKDGDGDGYIDFGVFDGDTHSAMRFVMGEVKSVWLDFNVDGVIWDKI